MKIEECLKSDTGWRNKRYEVEVLSPEDLLEVAEMWKESGPPKDLVVFFNFSPIETSSMIKVKLSKESHILFRWDEEVYTDNLENKE